MKPVTRPQQGWFSPAASAVEGTPDSQMCRPCRYGHDATLLQPRQVGIFFFGVPEKGVVVNPRERHSGGEGEEASLSRKRQMKYIMINRRKKFLFFF